MKKIILAAGFSLISTVAFAQATTTQGATTGANASETTSPNGVDSTTIGGQGTGAGANASGAVILPEGTSDDNMATGSMTPDMPKDAATAGANASATTSVGGVDSTTTGGQGTGAGADMAK
ncbi:hypothetical protein Sa4125_33360 [Aureimonas sp. SA4125]|uniref:hypothetical protein n=1 Tax=Aureimonas sp. SA4125 TaxID=2826993 RepID=UPI001CC37E79|nr:hypothetical protein [Aureimonas sp. SA4125]BDA85794.1 hypothetical protein Sa4125_33360 [Aureimonas sp. SA4125]